METKVLLKISLIVALISTFIISILAANLEPSVRNIETINERSIDEWVKIQGIVVQENVIENLKIFTVNDGTASITCIFRKQSNSLENKKVEVLGKVIDYKGTLEIEVNSIKILE